MIIAIAFVVGAVFGAAALIFFAVIGDSDED